MRSKQYACHNLLVDNQTPNLCGNCTVYGVIYFKFTKPKIQITGEYDAD